MRMLFRLLVFVAASFPYGLLAQSHYVVQIGAYRDPSGLDLEPARALGEVSSHPGDDGLTRITIGRFQTLNEAKLVMSRAVTAGYTDAFVSAYREARGATAVSPSQHMPAPKAARISRRAVHDPNRIAAARKKVSADRHKDVIYLDGRLVLREPDGSFRPLE